MKYLKVFGLSLLLIIPSILFVRQMMEWYTLKNGKIVFATVMKAPENCNSKRNVCLFKYKDLKFLKQISKHLCNNISVGDSLDFLYNEKTNDFVFVGSDDHNYMEVISSVLLVAFGWYAFLKLK